MIVRGIVRVVAVAALGATVTLACGSGHFATLPILQPTDAGVIDGASETGTIDFDAGDAALNCAADPTAYCGCTVIGQKPTPVYLVLDRSGSMADVIPPATDTKWKTITDALLAPSTGVLRSFGARVAIGATVFPGASASDACTTGHEVAPTTTGSDAFYDSLYNLLGAISPNGGTPTALTLTDLAPELAALPQPAYVLLATDGGPNCGTTPCDASECIPNIESDFITSTFQCTPTGENCCSDGLTGPGNCVDGAATVAAVESLQGQGIKTFVFGIPNTLTGDNPYATLLDQLAVAGGTAIAGATGSPASPKYYAATDASQAAFIAVLQAIAAQVVDSCDITLTSAPTNPAFVNVLLDGTTIPQDPVNGWSFGADAGDTQIVLNGTACAQVTSGAVSNVQVAVGCQTLVK